MQEKNDIKKLYEMGMYSEAKQYIEVFEKIYGWDEEIQEIKSMLQGKCNTEITVINLSEKNYINDDPKIIVVDVGKENRFKTVLKTILNSKTEFICFRQEEYFESESKYAILSEFMIQNPETEAGICLRKFVNKDGNLVSDYNVATLELCSGNLYSGTELLQVCIEQSNNLYGSLSCIIIRRNAFLTKEFLCEKIGYNEEEEDLILLLECFYGLNVKGIQQVLVDKVVKPINYIELEREKFLWERFQKRLLDIDFILEKKMLDTENKIIEKKEMTFFYTDKGEYYNLEPLACAATKRGWETKFTDNINESAEVGIYCQHICSPEKSKFSVILLHDMAQGHNRWPDIWNRERWNGFDIGVLPGDDWAERWCECGFQKYANPRKGVFKLGYPKGDIIDEINLENQINDLKERLNFKYDYTILYAPSWENDEKENDFVLALQSLKVNLLIKQAHWSQEFAVIIENIKKMRELHDGKYENVYYIESEESILNALKLCDFVVSDESSVMTEALLMGKPSIAVYDWLIPDTNPSRFASVPFDYVYKCKKVQLRETAEQLLDRIKKGQEPKKTGEYFSNLGHCNSDILDIIEYYTLDKEAPPCLNKKIESKYMPVSLWN